MENKEYRILLVDDEPDIIEFLSYNLKKEGFNITTVSDGKKAIETAIRIVPNLILLDVMMPGMDGIETCEKLREIRQLDKTIIAFLTARGEDYSQIAGFDAGGDDYITKPIKPKVLISRISALLKRVNWSNEERVSNSGRIVKGEITIDREKFMVYKGKEEFILPKKEFELLLLLSSKPGRVYTRDEIFDLVWGNDVVVGDRTIDVHVRKLREKLGDKYIQTIKGVGYKFAELD